MRKLAPGTAAVLAALIFAVAGGLCARTPAPKPTNESDTPLSEMELPFTTPDSGDPVVQFKVNGATEIYLALDTGATANVISESLAKKLGLQPKPYLVDNHLYLLDGKPARYASVASLSAGPYSFPGFGFLVADDKYFSDFKRYSVDGILGLGILNSDAVFIDYGQHKIAFMDSRRLDKKEIATLGFKPSPVKMTLSDDGLFQVPVTLTSGPDSATEEMAIDTGAANSAITYDIVDQLQLKTEGRYEQAGPFTGKVPVTAVKPDKIALGDIQISGQTILSYRGGWGSPIPTIGEDILGKCRVLLDFPAKKMYLEPAR